MSSTFVDSFLIANQKNLPSDKIAFVKEKLSALSEDRQTLIQSVEIKDTTTMLLFSVFLGSFGVDRFMLGQTGLGIIKLLTGGGCGVWTIVDWFMITSLTKEYNYNNLMMAI